MSKQRDGGARPLLLLQRRRTDPVSSLPLRNPQPCDSDDQQLRRFRPQRGQVQNRTYAQTPRYQDGRLHALPPRRCTGAQRYPPRMGRQNRLQTHRRLGRHGAGQDRKRSGPRHAAAVSESDRYPILLCRAFHPVRQYGLPDRYRRRRIRLMLWPQSTQRQLEDQYHQRRFDLFEGAGRRCRRHREKGDGGMRSGYRRCRPHLRSGA